MESVKYSGKLYQGHGPLEEQMEVDEEREDSAAPADGAADMDTSEGGGGVSSRPKRIIKVNTRFSLVNNLNTRLLLVKVPRKNSLDANAGGEDILVNPRRKNPGVGVKMTREVQEACDKINWGRVEEVMVSIRPWVRVDGTLNR